MAKYDDWIDSVQKWRDSTEMVPALVREDIAKGNYRPKEPSRGFKSLFEHPLDIQYSMGYKDRKYSLTYDVLKQMVQNLSILSAIINTRTNQISSFSAPFRLTKDLGFVIKHKKPGKLTTKGEREMIEDLEQFIYRCGAPTENSHSDVPRDDFETFLRKIVRDTLTYDQVCFEIVPARNGTPFEFRAVDASTIRLAASTQLYGPNNSWHNRPPMHGPHLNAHSRPDPYATMQMYGSNSEKPAYVQVIDGQIEHVFTRDEMAFGVRNPRTDIYIQGYGYGELEQLITIITAHLYAEEYNRRFFMQGSAPKGILAFKGDEMTADQLEGFRRQWRANTQGVENAWKTPVIQSEGGVDWINLNPTNREMEYGQWMEYLIKVTCGVFLIDPAELNFDLSGGVQQTPLFESSSEWKLKASRDRGLKPLLRFIAKMINDHVISKIDDNYVFDFIGLDELSEQEKHDLRMEQVQSYMTLNEIRRAEDLEDVDGGDMVMNPTYIQALQVRQQIEMQEQQNQSMGAGGPPQEGAAQQGMGEDENQDQDTPEYADQFTKSLGTKPVLEICIDEEEDTWIDLWRD